AYRAVVEFLDEHWRRRPVPGDFGDFASFCSYTPGVGTADPAMWYDWLAWVKKLQTGELVPDDRGWLTAEMMQPLNPEQAYLAMFEFIKEYWERVGHPTEIGDLLGQMRYTPGAGTADPELWKRWLAAIEKVQANR
ncbi:MAG TPA: hypothetical protein VFU23_10715, partial [Gemmatimonadales bacterium]|nr:hypothetical protein [Gemmatimonadales bacterium]